MLNQEENNNLKFGDQIIIKGSLSRGGQDYGGFLCGKGFVQDSIQFQVVPSDVLARASENESTLNFIKNQRDMVFQIWPRLNFQAHKQLRHLKKMQDHLQKALKKLEGALKGKRNQQRDSIIEIQAGTETKKQAENQKVVEDDKQQEEIAKLKEEIESFTLSIAETEIKVAKEKENNFKSLSQYACQPIGYGAEIQIRHVDSGLFLSSQTLASDSEKSAYRFLLSDDCSSGMLLRILPKFKLRNIGDTVQYRDQVIIQNIKLRFSVAFSEDQAIKGKNPADVVQVVQNEYKQMEMRNNDAMSFVVDTYISQYTEVVWEFRKFLSSTADSARPSQAICGGDLIRFIHKETNGYLSADIPYKNTQFPEVFFRKYEGDFAQEEYSASSVWEIEQVTDFNKGAVCFFGSNSDPVTYYLRHFQTGKLLTLNNGQFVLGQGMDERKATNDPNSLLGFFNTKVTESQSIDNQQCYQLNIQKNFIGLGANLDDVYENDKLVQIPGFFSQINDEELNLKRYKAVSSQYPNDENALLIERVSDQEKQGFLFAQSALPLLTKLTITLKQPFQKDAIIEDQIAKATSVLDKLIRFVYKVDPDEDLLNCKGISIVKNQQLLRDMGFIQTLTSLLYQPFKNKVFDPKQLTAMPKNILYVFQLSYVLIKLIIREYRPNEIFASQWLSLFMEQAMEYESKVDMLAEPTLTELIDNNETILKKKIDVGIITRFVNLLISEKSAKYIKLLRALINCDGKAMKMNQELIVDLLLVKNPDKLGLLNPLVLQQNGSLQIKIGDFLYEMEQLKDVDNPEVTEYINFYENLIWLLSDLCMDKQFVAINQLEGFFTYDICFTIINNPIYGDRLRSAFACLMKCCHVEGQRLQIIQAPEYIKVWADVYSQKTEAERKNQRLGSADVEARKNMSSSRFYKPTFTENPEILRCQQFYPEHFDKLKVFIGAHMTETTAQSKFRRVWESEQNEFTLQVIKLSKSLFEYGLYTDIEQIHTTIKPLISFLNASRDALTELDEKIKRGGVPSISKHNRSIDTELNGQDADDAKLSQQIAAQDRYAETEETVLISKSRAHICEILQFVNGLILNWMCDKILISYKKFYEDSGMSEMTLLQLVNKVRSRVKYLEKIQETDLEDKEAKAELDQLMLNPPEDVFLNPLNWIDERVNSLEFTIDSVVSKKKLASSNSKERLLNIFLLDLLQFENANMVKSSLTLLEANFSKRFNLLSYLKEIQIVDDERKYQVLLRGKRHFSQLQILVDETENWYALNSEKGTTNSETFMNILDELFSAMVEKAQPGQEDVDVDEILSDQGKDKKKQEGEISDGDEDDGEGGLLKHNNNANRNGSKQQNRNPLKKGKSSHKAGDNQDNDDGSNELDEEKLMQNRLRRIQDQNMHLLQIDINEDYFHEVMLRKNVRGEIQKMFRLLHLHEPILELIINDLLQTKKEDQTKRKQILRKCFKVLAIFCFENQANQRALLPHLSTILNHLKSEKENTPQILLNEIVRENEDVLFDYSLCHTIINHYADILNSQDTNDPTRPAFFEYLTTFMKTRQGNMIRSNQVEIVITLTNPKYQKILSLFDEGTKETALIIQKVKELTVSMTANSSEAIQIPGELQYFIQLLDMLSVACEEKNDATESKSQNYFPLDMLLSLLAASPQCWPFRKALMMFFYHVYLETEKDIDDNDSILKMMKVVKSDLQYLADNASKLLASPMKLKNFQGTLPMGQLIQQYIFGVLLFCVKEFARRNLVLQRNEMNAFNKTVMESMIKLQAVIGEQNEESKIFIAQIVFLILKKQTVKVSQDILKLKESFSSDIQGYIRNYEEQKMTLEKYEKQQRIDFDRISILKLPSLKFHVLFSSLSNTTIFTDNVQQEFEQLTATIKQIQPLSIKVFKNQNTITFEQLCRKLCAIISPSNAVLSEEQCLMGMRVLRKFIEGENKEKKVPASEWGNESDETEIQVLHKQNILADYGVIKVVCEFLRSEFSTEIKNEAVLLGIAMLYGGNTKCQETLLACLQEDTQNTVMICLNDMVDFLSSRIKKSMSRRNRQFVDNFRRNLDEQLRLKRAGKQNLELATETNEKQKEKADQKEQEEQESVLSDLYANSKIYDEEMMIQDLRKVYRFLQLFCEGHFLPLQDYLREQRQNGDLNPQSINFVKLVAQNFGSYIRYMNDLTVNLGQQIIDLLVESVQGPCRQNQKCISDNKIVDYTKELLSTFSQPSDYEKRGIDSEELRDNVDQVVSKSTLLLVSLLEGNTQKDIPLYIDQQLDYSFVRSFLANQYSDYVKEKLNLDLADVSVADVIEKSAEVSQTFSGQIEEAFNIFILIMTVKDQLKRFNTSVESEAAKCIEQKTDTLEDAAMDFFSQNTCCIEVFFQEKISRVFFIKHPACQNIPKKSREIFNNEVERGTLNEKLECLVAESETFIIEMDLMTTLKGWPLRFTSNRFQGLQKFSTFLAFLINIVMVASLDRTVLNNQSSQDSDPPRFAGMDSLDLIYALGLVQLICNLIMMIFWLVLNVPIILAEKWHNLVESNQSLVDPKKEAILEQLSHPKYFSIELTTYALKTKGPSYQKFVEDDHLRMGSLFGYLKYAEVSFMLLMKDSSFLYLVFYIACSVCGFFFDKIIYAFQLLDIINQFPTLRNVTLAVERNASQLLKTFLLGIIVIFIFSVIGYSFAVEDYFFGDQGSGGENLCNNLFHCFIESINLGLRNGGGVGDSMRLMSFGTGNRSKYIFRVIYDIAFFAFINVILINVIFGVIIDTFAELRDQKSEVIEDMKNICFICGLDRYVFDKNADGFENHIERDHQLWNYVFYMYFLSKKESTDYNGIETEVSKKIELGDISWFPMMKAISIGEQEDQNELADIVVQSLNDVGGQFKELQDKISSLVAQQKKEQLKNKQLANANKPK